MRYLPKSDSERREMLAACGVKDVETFDDPYFGDLLEPSLTAVAYDPRSVGALAAELLVEGMQSRSERRELRVPVTLVRRGSCGCEAKVAR